MEGLAKKCMSLNLMAVKCLLPTGLSVRKTRIKKKLFDQLIQKVYIVEIKFILLGNVEFTS